MAEPNHLRLFVAIRAPEAARADMLSAQKELERAAAKARVRWCPPEQFHLTLRFLGDVASESVQPLKLNLAQVCCAFKPLRLKVGGIGFFPDAKFPRVVWVGLHEAADQLVAFQSAIEQACRDFTTEPADKKFTGHITLGRIKAINREQARALASVAESMESRSLGEWAADELELVQSELSQTGARHEIIADIPLGK